MLGELYNILDRKIFVNYFDDKGKCIYLCYEPKKISQ